MNWEAIKKHSAKREEEKHQNLIKKWRARYPYGNVSFNDFLELEEIDSQLGLTGETPLLHKWHVLNMRTGKTVVYNSLIRRPVSKSHVKDSPSVRRWAGDDPIKIVPPEEFKKYEVSNL